jgi:hypothetical protein
MSSTSEINAVGPTSGPSADVRQAMLQDADLGQLGSADDEVRFAPNDPSAGGSRSGSSCGVSSSSGSDSGSACGATTTATDKAGSACTAGGCCPPAANSLSSLAAASVNAISKNSPSSTKPGAATETDEVLNSFGELMFDFARKPPSASARA